MVDRKIETRAMEILRNQAPGTIMTKLEAVQIARDEQIKNDIVNGRPVRIPRTVRIVEAVPYNFDSPSVKWLVDGVEMNKSQAIQNGITEKTLNRARMNGSAEQQPFVKPDTITDDTSDVKKKRVKMTVSFTYELDLDDFDGNQEDLDQFTSAEAREDAYEFLRDEGPDALDVVVKFEDGTTEVRND